MSEAEKRQKKEEIRLKTLKMLENRDKNKVVKEVYRKSTKAKPKKVHGNTYISKENKDFIMATIVPAVLGVTALVLASKGFSDILYIDDYKTKLNVVAEAELSPKEYEQFEKDHSDDSMSEYYDDLKKAEALLKEDGNYSFMGEDKDNPGKYPRTKDELDGLFILSDLKKDAINEAIENEIEEYKGRGK